MNCKTHKIKRKRNSTNNNFESLFNISNKKAKKTLGKLSKVNLDIISKEQDKKMEILVNSEKSSSKYKVTMIANNEGIKMCCNCGEKFGIPKRYNCKHISSIIFFQFKNYINSINIKQPKEIINQLDDLFKSLSI